MIQRNDKNVGKHLFGIGNISASCSNVFLSNKVYEVYESIEKHQYTTFFKEKYKIFVFSTGY